MSEILVIIPISWFILSEKYYIFFKSIYDERTPLIRGKEYITSRYEVKPLSYMMPKVAGIFPEQLVQTTGSLLSHTERR